MEQWTGSKLGRKHVKAVYCHSAYLTLMQGTYRVKCQAEWSTSWNQDSWETYQQPQFWRWYHLNGRKWMGTKEFLNEGERGEWKAGLKLSIQKTKIMASSPITSWQIEGKKWKQWQILFSWAPTSLQMVTAVTKLKDACSLQEKLWQTRTAEIPLCQQMSV